MMQKTSYSIVVFLIFFWGGYAQNKVICRVSPDNSKLIQLKWYCPTIVNGQGFYVYRKESSSDNWVKLTKEPVMFRSYTIPEELLKKDKELKSYVELASKPENIKDLALLAVLIKSFKSDVFSHYLGIRYDDTSVEKDKGYYYKVTLATTKGDTDLAVSEKITFTEYSPIAAPKNIISKTGNKKVSFQWEPEPDAYFGVNIYRKTNDTGQFRKLTKDPILLSKTKNKEGLETYGEVFYVDTKLKPHVRYEYLLEAVDFFGDPSKKSDPIVIRLNDLDPPAAPDSIYSKVDGKKVLLKWKKKSKEEDLQGFNVYRTSKNDTDYAKINTTLIPITDSTYLDQLTQFHSYMYAVSSLDADGNESLSSPFQVEAFDNEAPAKPKNLIIEADSGQLKLKWDANTEQDLKGYLVYRTIDKNSEDTYVKITPSAILENYFSDKLAKNTKNKFVYKIVALDASMNRSPYSECAMARMPDVTAPNAPFLKTILQNEKAHVLLEWFPNAEPDLAGYNILRKNIGDSNSTFKKLNTKLLEPNVFRYTDRYAEEGILYEYYVQAVDSSQNLSPSSNHLNFKLKNLRNEENALRISNFNATYNTKKRRVELSWRLKNSESLKGCVIYKLKSGEITFSPISGIIEEIKLTDVEVKNGENYTYQLRAYDLKGDVLKSEKITLTIK